MLLAMFVVGWQLFRGLIDSQLWQRQAACRGDSVNFSPSYDLHISYCNRLLRHTGFAFLAEAGKPTIIPAASCVLTCWAQR